MTFLLTSKISIDFYFRLISLTTTNNMGNTTVIAIEVDTKIVIQGLASNCHKQVRFQEEGGKHVLRKKN